MSKTTRALSMRKEHREKKKGTQQLPRKNMGVRFQEARDCFNIEVTLVASVGKSRWGQVTRWEEEQSLLLWLVRTRFQSFLNFGCWNSERRTIKRTEVNPGVTSWKRSLWASSLRACGCTKTHQNQNAHALLLFRSFNFVFVEVLNTVIIVYPNSLYNVQPKVACR